MLLKIEKREKCSKRKSLVASMQVEVLLRIVKHTNTSV